MTDIDRMGDLQEAAHKLQTLAHVHPGTPPPPLAEHAENLRSARLIAVSLGLLLGQTAEQLTQMDGYVSRVKNPRDAVDQIGAARGVAAHVAGALNSVGGALQAAEMALGRIEPAPPEPQPRLTVVPHDVAKCGYCENPTIRAAVLAEQTPEGWMCSKCGWATVDLGTMHEQLWPAVTNVHEPAVDMVCPGCGAIGEFVDYPEESSDG